MAETLPTDPSLPPVKVDDFMADRARFADGVWTASVIGTGSVIALLVLMAIFLL